MRWRRWYDHLDLAEADVGGFDAGGELAVGALQREEGHVAVARNLERCRLARFRRDVSVERSVDEGLVGAALLPDASVGAAFDEDGLVVARQHADVAGEGGDGGVPGGEPARVFTGKLRNGGARSCRVLRGQREAGSRVEPVARAASFTKLRRGKSGLTINGISVVRINADRLIHDGFPREQ